MSIALEGERQESIIREVFKNTFCISNSTPRSQNRISMQSSGMNEWILSVCFNVYAVIMFRSVRNGKETLTRKNFELKNIAKVCEKLMMHCTVQPVSCLELSLRMSVLTLPQGIYAFKKLKETRKYIENILRVKISFLSQN